MLTTTLAEQFQLSDNQKGPMVIVIGVVIILGLIAIARKK